MNLVIIKCVTAVKVSNFTGDYLPNRSTLDIGVLGFFGIVSHKEHPPEVWSFPPVTPCIYTTTDYTKTLTFAKYFSNCYSFIILFLSKCSYAQKY